MTQISQMNELYTKVDMFIKCWGPHGKWLNINYKEWTNSIIKEIMEQRELYQHVEQCSPKAKNQDKFPYNIIFEIVLGGISESYDDQCFRDTCIASDVYDDFNSILTFADDMMY